MSSIHVLLTTHVHYHRVHMFLVKPFKHPIYVNFPFLHFLVSKENNHCSFSGTYLYSVSGSNLFSYFSHSIYAYTSKQRQESVQATGFAGGFCDLTRGDAWYEVCDDTNTAITEAAKQSIRPLSHCEDLKWKQLEILFTFMGFES